MLLFHTRHLGGSLLRQRRLPQTFARFTAPAAHTPTRCFSAATTDEPAKSTPEPDTRATLKRIAQLATPEYKLIAASMGTLVFTSSISLVFPYALGRILDVSLSDGGTLSPNLVAGGLMGLFVVQGGMIVARSAMLSIAGERIVSRFRKQLFSSIIGQEVGFFDKNRTGDLINRLSADTQLVQKAATVNMVSGLRATFMSIGGTGMLVYTSPTLALVSLSVIPPVALGARYFGRYIKKIQSDVQGALAETTSVAEEMISNIRTVRQFANEPLEAAHYDERVNYAFRKSVEAGLASAWFDGAVHLAANTSLVAVLAYGGSQVMNQEITAGALTSFLMYSVYVGFNVSNLSSVYSELMRAVGASSRIFSIVDRVPEIPSSMTSPAAFPLTVRPRQFDGEHNAKVSVPPRVPLGSAVMERVERNMPHIGDAVDPSGLYVTGGLAQALETSSRLNRDIQIQGNIAFRDVHFTYPVREHDPILRGVNLEVDRGHSLALVGASGSGKSTIGSLLTRLYDPSSGEILVDGVPIRDIDPHVLRRQIGVVSQEPALFATTIEENIRYGATGDDITDKQVWQAAAAAGCTPFLEEFPKGMQTMVGERGIQLSGGQKQRIAVARAILKNPPIVLLDEATSALDAESEHHVQRAIEQMMKGRTVISIAHRLSTMKAADRIAMIDNGVIVETGKFDELMARKDESPFYQLVHRQLEKGGAQGL